ncbi:MAG TPA: phosphatase PAP2 family protein [Pseudonocardiaceae bacterium]
MIVIVLAIIVVAVSGMHYADQDMPGHLDRGLDAIIRSHIARSQPITRALVSLGDPAQAALLVAAVAGAAAVAKRWSGVLLVIISTVAAATISELILKPVVGRLRYGHLSFPSGHSTVVATIAIATVILLIGARRPRNIALRLLASLVAVAVAVGAAISLISEHVHYTTDTIAGSCVALATVLAVALFIDFATKRPAG